ncbi:MAG: hypothetical protein M0R77_18855 [Gammaproteobacteria bacterium]|nr:hypothetical protein [Gammaproteobacteria bacterium]
MNNELKITVSGMTGTGKSHLSQLLSEFLEAVGFNVEIDNDEFIDLSERLMEVVSDMALQTKIVIEEVNIPRPARRGNYQEI